ncbi:MAG: phosphoribosylformylglycinamidine cyclo-ligase [Verrucomicrobiae bacterium]|nr:phosphoribosylformylglycinamidine cyclo-ligase [Verrucomicrobiae bacterium]
MDLYAKSGVNLQLARRMKAGLPALLRRATRPGALGRVGAFGGLFRASFPKMRDPVLVASMDGVGTKLRVAVEMRRYETVGQDLVNHCCNDIAVMGAEPLFFLDYLGTGKLEPAAFRGVLAGLAKACAEARVALLGGETAQMPGIYRQGDFDLVGTIVGVVERKAILDGSRIRSGDAIVGLASTGLHTNGYSLARDILFRRNKLRLSARPRELGGATLGETLLRVHRNYSPFLAALRRMGILLHGASHITGGGFEENISRILPARCAAVVRRDAWPVPPIFDLIRRRGDVSAAEMHRVFNMGVGLALFLSSSAVPSVLRAARRHGLRAFCIGEVVAGRRAVRLV